MDILVDENIPLMSVKQLRKMGHDVVDVRGTAEQGMSDELLWNKASQEKRLFITTDRGFSHYRDREHYGILIVSLRRPNRYRINERVIEAIRQFSHDHWPGLLVIMRDKTMSIWRPGKRSSFI
jgi:predicted nuclease of predicted toxin-antitoxin system